MPTGKRLPSGSWRCQAYSHSEPVLDAKGNIVIDSKTKKVKMKRVYESFTSDDPTKKGKQKAEQLANYFIINRKDRHRHTERLTLHEAIEKYITASSVALSPKTVEEYWKVRENGFQSIMATEIRKLDDDTLQNAITLESNRPNKKCTKNPKPISPKTVRNEYGLISAVITRYRPDYKPTVKLPTVPEKIINLPSPETIFDIVKGTEMELGCLLAMWLSFSMEEIRGLKKSTSIQGDYIVINQVMITVNNKHLEKDLAKTPSRIRKLRMPYYIRKLIDDLPENQDYLVTKNGSAFSKQFKRIMKKHNIDMNFHKLRHVNASVMALLRISDKYALERGGWKTDRVMKKVYTHTFSDRREEADQTIDQYFEEVLSMSDQENDIDYKKYNAWLTLYGKDDSDKSKSEFLYFMQHEIQHETTNMA